MSESPNPSPNTPKDAETEAESIKFADLGLSTPLLATLQQAGYDTPTPIQAQAIPPLLEGGDVLGLAQTGTGKTAAFSLPILERLDSSNMDVQALVLAPTRELAIQVSSAFSRYSQQLQDVRILTIYGGAPIHRQLSRLERGVHVVVGTPGRVMDCMRRGALSLSTVRMLVIDEADEMLRMGFVDDIEWILERAPQQRQLALFSATMSPPIERVAKRYLSKPTKVELKAKTRTVDKIDQRVVIVRPHDKFETLVRLLEVEKTGAVLVFARTKIGCAELAEALEQRGFSASPLHGDLNQNQRQDVVRRLKAGHTELVVATDVAARGLDIDDITHVINFDPPSDADTYVHRVGRTGRAGREGVSYLILTPRDRHKQRLIERHTRQHMSLVQPPSNAEIAAGRRERLIQIIDGFIPKAPEEASEEAGHEGEEDATHEASSSERRDAQRQYKQLEYALAPYREFVEQMAEETGHDLATIAAGLARFATRGQPLIIDTQEPMARKPPHQRPDRRPRAQRDDGPPQERMPPRKSSWGDDGAKPHQQRRQEPRPSSWGSERDPRGSSSPPQRRDFRGEPAPYGSKPPRKHPDHNMVKMFVSLGRGAGLVPRDIVGAVANEAGIPGNAIGAIEIGERFSFFGLDEGHVAQVLDRMGNTVIRGRRAGIRIARPDGPPQGPPGNGPRHDGPPGPNKPRPPKKPLRHVKKDRTDGTATPKRKPTKRKGGPKKHYRGRS